MFLGDDGGALVPVPFHASATPEVSFLLLLELAGQFVAATRLGGGREGVSVDDDDVPCARQPTWHWLGWCHAEPGGAIV